MSQSGPLRRFVLIVKFTLFRKQYIKIKTIKKNPVGRDGSTSFDGYWWRMLC